MPKTIYVNGKYDDILGPLSAIATDARVNREIVHTDDDHNSIVFSDNDSVLMSAIRQALASLLTASAMDVSGGISISHDEKFANYITEIPQITTFLGRETELISLKKQLLSSESVVSINGIGGIGKTSLARAFVHKNQADFQNIAWVDCVNKSIRDAFIDLTFIDQNFKNLQSSGTTSEQKFELIISALHQVSGRGLMVIDNVEKDIEEIKSLLPQYPKWQIILTSRHSLSFKMIEVERLTDENAVALFKEYYGKSISIVDMESLHILLNEIGFHTLTIELIAKTMATSDNNLRFDEVITILQNRKLDDLRMREIVNVNHWKAEEVTLYEHLLLTFKIANLSNYEIWVLQMFSVLPPLAIYRNLLIELLQIDQNDAYLFKKTLKQLRAKGWIRRNEDSEGNAMYIMHRIVQNTIQYQNPITLEVAAQLIETFTTLFSYHSGTNFTEKFAYVPYLEYFLKVFPYDFENEEIAILHDRLGLVYRYLGDYDKAEKAFTKALLLFQAWKNSIGEINVWSHWGVLYQLKGDYEAAKVFFENALKSSITVYGVDSDIVATCKANLATIYADLGDFEIGITLIKSAVEILIDRFGFEDNRVQLNLSNQAMLHRKLGQYDDARELLERVLEFELRTKKPNHPDIAVDKSNLAMVLNDLGIYDRAKGLLQEALEIDLKNEVPGHIKIATRYLNIAKVHYDSKNYEEALSFALLAYNSFKDLFGETYNSTQDAMSLINKSNEKLVD